MRLFRVDEFDDEFISDMLQDIYRRATDWLWFSTSLYPEFFNRDDIRETITQVANSGVSIRILLDEEVDVHERQSEVPWIFDHDNIEIRQSSLDSSHRVISDRTDMRLEKEHKITEMGAANLIAMDAVDDLSDPYVDEFETWWDSAENVG